MVPKQTNFSVMLLSLGGFTDGSSGKELTYNTGDTGDAGDRRDADSIPGLGSQTSPVFLPGKSHGQRNLADCSPWGRKELDITEVT